MGEVQATPAIQTTQNHELTAAKKDQGTIKTSSGEHSVDVFPGTEVVSEGVNEFLNQEQLVEPSEHQFNFIDGEEILQTQQEIDSFLEELSMPDQPTLSSPTGGKAESKPLSTPQNLGESTSLQKASASSNPAPSNGPLTQPSAPSSKVVYPSLFHMARALSPSQTEGKQPARAANLLTPNNRTDHRSAIIHSLPQVQTNREEGVNANRKDNPYDEEREQKEGSHQHKQQQDQKDDPKKPKRNIAARKIEAPTGNGGSSRGKANEVLRGIGNIYIRFMALMARILGQAEAEGHQLYLRIKERTDNIDTLTLLISKINSSNEDIDWSKDEEMKKLVDKAREIGVDIPKGKYSWSEDDKRVLKENIQMRKDSMEKITQLERTDMQRYLQEASQCHQARSNVLKLMKEVMDTIIYNMRA